MTTRTTPRTTVARPVELRRPLRWPLALGAAILTVIVVAVAVVLRPVAAPLTPDIVPSSVGDAIPGQPIVFLVSFSDDGTSGVEAEVAAEAQQYADDVAITVAPERIAAGEVAEVTVVIDDAVVADLPEDGEQMLGRPAPVRPAPDDGRVPVEPDAGPRGPEGVEVPLRITLTRGAAVETTDVSINVSRGEDTLLDAATPLRDRFVVWLAAERPELGITADTEWTPAIVQPHILVVSHYLFFSEDWEMGLMWHIMIPPHDWSRIYLRPRGELAPTMAFEIPSVAGSTSQIREIDVPAAVDR